MDSFEKPDNASVELATFLDRHEYRLPTTVKIELGFCGIDEAESLEVGQILVLYKVERQKTVVALDQLGQEICVQENSNIKANLLPLKCQELSTVKDLLTADSPHFLVLDDIQSSLHIVSGSKLTLMNVRSAPNFLTLEAVHGDDSREVRLPLHLSGRFLPLLDVKDYHIEEILAKNDLPVNIRFVSPSTQAKQNHFSALSLMKLGNIRLTRKAEVEMVFAASYDKELLLHVFPKTLDISVGCGFKVPVETGKRIQECRQTIETSKTKLKRLDNLMKDSFYFAVIPVRRFNLRSLEIPPERPPRIRRAKQDTPLQESHDNIEESTKRDRLPSSDIRRCFQPSYGEIQEGGDYENYATSGTTKLKESIIAFPATSEVTNDGFYRNSEAENAAMIVPPLPPKSRSPSTAGEATKAPPHSPRPVPKPRERNARGKEVSHEELNHVCVSQAIQKQTEELEGCRTDCTAESDHGQKASPVDPDDEVGPELPPKPVFLLSLHSEEIDGLDAQEENPPALPPKKGKQCKVPCPGEEHTDSEHDDTDSRDENILPLPPRNKPQGLAYQVTDVTDWKKVEENYRVYAEVKDDGQCFRQGDFVDMKGQKLEEKGRHHELSERKILSKHAEDESSDDDHSYEEMEGFPEKSQAVDGRSYEEIDDFPEKSRAVDGRSYEEIDDFPEKSQAVDGRSYEEIDDFPEKSQAVFSKRKKQKKTTVRTTPTNGSSITSSRNEERRKGFSALTSQVKSHPRISTRREEDFMDINDVTQFFKLRSQLKAARAQVQELKKQVQEQDPAERTRPFPPRKGTSGISDTTSESKIVEKDSKDENNNSLVSTEEFGELVEKLPENRQKTREVSETQALKKQPQLSPVPGDIAPENVGEVAEYRGSSETIVIVSDDEDDYEKCFERKYVNQEILVSGGEDDQSEDVSDYRGTVGRETSHYLHLGSPSDEDENVSVNFDEQEENPSTLKGNIPEKNTSTAGNWASDRTLHDSNSKAFSVEEECSSVIPPPLPAKRRVGSTSSTDY